MTAARFPRPGGCCTEAPLLCRRSLATATAASMKGCSALSSRSTLASDKSLHGRRVLAQDLAGHEAIDISSMVQVRGKNLHLPGDVIRQIGLHSATPGDISAPGLVIAIS